MTSPKETSLPLTSRDRGEPPYWSDDPFDFVANPLPEVIGASSAYKNHPVSECWTDPVSGIVMCRHRQGSFANYVDHPRPGGARQYELDLVRYLEYWRNADV